MNKDIENNAISDNELEDVNGGLLFYAGDVEGADPRNPWEVINNASGEVVRRFNNYDDACDYARTYGPNPENVREVKWGELQSIRERSSRYTRRW